MWIKIIFLCLFLHFVCFSQARRTKRPIDYGSCARIEYRCINDKCIDRKFYCDGVDDCGDKSDEIFCNVDSGDKHPGHFKRFPCEGKYPTKYIPAAWRCDGSFECSNKRDETVDCATFSQILLDDIEHVNGSISSRTRAINWLQHQRQNISGTGRWGTNAPRIAIALYLSDPKYFDGSNCTGNEIAYEIDNQILISILRAGTEPLSINQLALYVHARLVTCSDPRDFHGINLVDQLRKLADSESIHPRPYVFLALCNANDEMTANDVNKLMTAFEQKGRPSYTSTRALALMALVCIAEIPKERNGPVVTSSTIKNISAELKRQQYNNGSFENIQTTALVMQAVFASGTEDDGDWNMEEAVKFLIKSQKSDGSYGNFLNTYFVSPVLYYNSLTNISSNHCKKETTDDGVTALEKLGFKIGKRLFVKYTLWVGDRIDLAYSLELRVIENSTMFEIMHIAKSIGSKYDFQYYLVNVKPYVYQLAGYQDNPESEKFWFLYKANATGFATTLIKSSPVDVIPKNKDEYIMWYRSEQIIDGRKFEEIK